MTHLPRGQFSSQTAGAPLATARWASAEEIGRYRYRGNGDIYLGALRVPPEEAHGAIERLASFMDVLAADIDIDPVWKAPQMNRAGDLRTALMTHARMPVGTKDDRHLITVAGSRAGKGVSAVIPNLVLYPGSVLAIDPKGANARLTSSRRGKGSKHCRGLGQKVYVLDPYKVSKVSTELFASYNPLNVLKVDDEQIIDKASSIAEAMIVKSGEAESGHFEENARILIKGLILFVVLNVAPKDRNLPFVHHLLTKGVRKTSFDIGPLEGGAPDPQVDYFRALLRLMEADHSLDGVVSGIASTILDMGDREYGSVLSTARQNCEFLERPAIRRTLASSSFSFDELKSAPEGITIYLCLPVTRMEDCGRFLRLMIATALESIYAVPEQPACGHPVLFLLEEFAVLKHMAVIETAAGYAAEFGLKLWVILQDLSQLKRHYSKGWETFMANASLTQAFGNSDLTTCEYLSKKLGETETIQTTQTRMSSLSSSANDAGEFQLAQALVQNRGPLSIANPLMLMLDRETRGESATTSSSSNEQVQRSPLLLPDEIERVFRREAMTQIVAIKGERPFALVREAYYEAPEFLGLFEPDRAPYRTVEEAEALAANLAHARAQELSALIVQADAFVTGATRAIAAARAGKR